MYLIKLSRQTCNTLNLITVMKCELVPTYSTFHHFVPPNLMGKNNKEKILLFGETTANNK